MAVIKKYENFDKKKVFWETRSDARSPQQDNWAHTYQSQIHTPNPYYVEKEKESVDGEFQESEIIDKEFEHECVEEEDTSQGSIDWDSPPTYDKDVNEEDSVEEPLASNLEEEYEEYGLHPIFGSLYPDEDDQLEEEEPTYDIADYEEIDEGLQVRCLIIMKKRLNMLISLVLKIF